MNILTEPHELARYAAELHGGVGPVALDAERASGFRYSQRAYLIQVNRREVGTALIDPIALPTLEPLIEAIGDAEWVLHAATQDLPCLAEVGLRPAALFDTELAGRLLGRERVSLAALVEAELGVTLTKGHGAADWSARPLSAAQRRYAALDVAYLVDLRDRLQAALEAEEKWSIAQQEFSALLNFQPRMQSSWRRLSGLHRLRTPEARAIARELWEERDQRARAQDLAPGRVLRDADIIAIALDPDRVTDAWRPALERARVMPEPPPPPSDGVPPPRTWAAKRPEAAARWALARPALDAAAEARTMPVENLMSPALVRQVLWDPPADLSEVPNVLAAHGARPWQIEAVAPLLQAACETASREVTDQ